MGQNAGGQHENRAKKLQLNPIAVLQEILNCHHFQYCNITIARILLLI